MNLQTLYDLSVTGISSFDCTVIPEVKMTSRYLFNEATSLIVNEQEVLTEHGHLLQKMCYFGS
jgi:hypothetical protein